MPPGSVAGGSVFVGSTCEVVGFLENPGIVVVDERLDGVKSPPDVGSGAFVDSAKLVAAAKSKPGVNGCVSNKLRSESAHLICSAGPAVKVEPSPVGEATNPHMPPLKSVVSEVQAKPLCTR